MILYSQNANCFLLCALYNLYLFLLLSISYRAQRKIIGPNIITVTIITYCVWSVMLFSSSDSVGFYLVLPSYIACLPDNYPSDNRSLRLSYLDLSVTICFSVAMYSGSQSPLFSLSAISFMFMLVSPVFVALLQWFPLSRYKQILQYFLHFCCLF